MATATIMATEISHLLNRSQHVGAVPHESLIIEQKTNILSIFYIWESLERLFCSFWGYIMVILIQICIYAPEYMTKFHAYYANSLNY